MDITLCKGYKCPQKETCVRYKGEPNPYRQSYFAEDPRVDNKCEYYWEIKVDTPLTEKEEMRQFINKFDDIIKDTIKTLKK